MVIQTETNFITALPDSHAAGITPMIEQFLAVKRDHADCLLFYRMGDFYEMFFQDAIDAAQSLDITLTKRGKINDMDIPMCGVPVHAADVYLSRLIKKGYRVAICEQAEKPQEAKARGHKGPLKREVIRIVTPGTLVEDEFLPPRQNNFLIALGEAMGEMALSWVDLSTGDFLAETIEESRLAEALTRLDGAELIVNEQKAEHYGFSTNNNQGLVGCVSLRPAQFFNSRDGEKQLCRIYGTSTLDGMASLTKAEIAAAGALAHYLEQTQKGQSLRLKPIIKLTSGAVMEIDPASRASLEITKTLTGKREGSLLAVIDKTITAPGGRLLANRIAAPLTDLKEINARLDLVTAALNAPMLEQNIGDALKTMPDLERALSRLQLQHGGPRDLAAIAQGLQAAYTIAQIIKEQNQNLIAVDMLTEMAEHLEKPYPLVAQIGHALADDLPLMARDGDFIRTGFSAELDELKSLRDESRQLIAQLQVKYSTNTDISSLKIKHNNVLGYHIEVRSNHADKLLTHDDFIHRQTTAQATRFTTTELAELEQKMSSAGEKALALELTLFEELREHILTADNDILTVAASAARLDVMVATARLANTSSYCRPSLSEGRAFNIEKGRHPVVEKMLDSDHVEAFISNDCSLNDDDRIWLITGPNMAGKSTFLRQNALIALMAQAGLYVPAAKAEIGVVNRLFCRVGASDDLSTGRSTFMVEMVETAAILNRSDQNSLVILDEIGRGTATYDGLSLAWAVVEHLHEVNQCRTLFATHYHELNTLNQTLNALSSHSMQVKEWQDNIVFLHSVASGGADRSYGIHVARLAGIPQAALTRAESILELLSEQKQNLNLDDMPLFSAAPPRQEPQNKELMDYINTLFPDTMSPREALDALYTLLKIKDKSQ